MKGKVKFFNEMKEYGFIIADDEKEYFFHKSGLKEDTNIDKDDVVSFELKEGDRGKIAVEIEVQ